MKSKILLFCFCVLFLHTISIMAGEVVRIGTADNNVIMIVVETPDGEDAPVHDASLWKVNGVDPTEVGRYTYVWYEERAEGDNFPMALRHHIYLRLSSVLTNNTTYNISTPYGDQVLVFNDNETLCESIHVNQVGYFGESTIRYANLGIYLGDLGTRSLSSLPQYTVIPTDGGTAVATGTLTYWGNDSTGGYESGEHIYRINLSDVPEGGPYIISVSGFGCSYPFGVGNSYINQSAYIHVRGLYHQRCGIALEEPYTTFTRGTCHTSAEITDALPSDFINDRGAPIEIHGGYHDAGDFDRRLSHTLIPAWMLSLYEAFPSNFTDNQYNIPESGNGIPDFLDEALWGLKVWEYLQDTSGGVRAGTETNAHPAYGSINAETDGLIYKTYAIWGHNTASGAGLFSQASRLVKPYDTTRASELLTRAEKAWEYLQNNGSNPNMASAHDAQKMYAALQLYLATENNDYHTAFQQHANYCLTSGWPEQYKPHWYNIPLIQDGMIFSPYFFSYLITNLSVNQTLKDALDAMLTTQANNSLNAVNEKPYPIGSSNVYAWGTVTNQGRYADPMIYKYRLTKETQYLDAISQLADYSLGLNPLGKSYVTGLGANPPNCPLHLDSYFTYKDGKGNVPGIVVYGPVADPSSVAYQIVVWEKVYPAFGTLPIQRRYTDGWSFVGADEFTTWETMAQNAVMYAFLSSEGGGGTVISPPVPSGLNASAVSDDQINLNWTVSPDQGVTGYRIYRDGISVRTTAFTNNSDTGLVASTTYTYTVAAYNAAGYESDQSSSVSATTNALGLRTVVSGDLFDVLKISPNPLKTDTKIYIEIKGREDYQVNVYDIYGQKVKQLFDGELMAGNHEIIWNGTNERGDRVMNGTYILRVGTNNFFKAKKIVVIK